MNRPFKPSGQSLSSFAADKLRREIAQMLEHRPEELLGHLGGSNFVGVGQIVAAGRGGTPETGQRTRMQPQRVTHIIKPDAMSQLRIHKGKDVAPRTECPDFLFHAGLSSQSRNEKVGNEIAYLPQQIQLRARWNGLVVFNHPCRVAGLGKPFQPFRQFPMGWL